MKQIIENWWKIILISLFGVIVWGFFRSFIFRKIIFVMDPADIIAYGDSILFTNGIFLPVLTVIGIIVLLFYSIFYVLLKEGIAGNKYIKGLFYGVSFAIIYFIAIMEFYHFFNGNFIDGVFGGIADGVSLLITGIILGIFIPAKEENKSSRPMKYLLSILFIAVIFTIGRIFFYSYIYSTPLIKQLNSYIYLSVYGAAFGIAYYYLSQGIKTNNYYYKSILFGLIQSPIIISGNMFICLRYQFPLMPVIIISIIDIMAIIAGGLLTEFVFFPSHKKI